MDAIEELVDHVHKQESEKKAKELIEKAQGMAVGQRSPAQAFFTSLALSMPVVPDWTIDTMATDGIRIRYNPDFTNSLPLKEVHGVVVGHEPMHCVNMHFSRMPGLYASGNEVAVVQAAADLEINTPLVECGFAIPNCGIFPGKDQYRDCPPGLTMEEYVVILNKRPKSQQPKGGDPGGCGVAVPADDQAAAEAKASQWQGKVASAAQLAAQIGTLPGSLQQVVDGILKPRIDPWEILRDHMTRIAKSEVSWTRLNRRHAYNNLYLPSRSGMQLGEVVLLVDCSGSVDDDQLRLIAGFLEGVLSANPATLYVIFHDTAVHHVEEWTPGSGPLNLKRYGGGGTAHGPALQEIVNRGLEPTVILAATDMETTWPDDPGIPFIWIATEANGITPPFGDYVLIA